MPIGILTNHKEADSWKAALAEKLPNVSIDIYGESKNAVKAPFLVCWKPKKDQLKVFSNLKVIQSLGAGVDHIFDTNTIPATVKVVRIIDERLTVDMWEYVLTAIMHHLKDFSKYTRQESYQYWQQHRYKTIPETTVAVLGLGQIGGYVAKQLAKIGFKVLGWSNSPKKIRKVKNYIGQKQLQTLLKKTDVLVNILPLTDATQGILNKDLFQQLPKDAYVINVGRGGHLVEMDLLDCIENKHLAGATLDVFAQEPLSPNHPFWKEPKIKITPHVASLTNVESAVNQVVENYNRMVRGVELLNEVSPIKGY